MRVVLDSVNGDLALFVTIVCEDGTHLDFTPEQARCLAVALQSQAAVCQAHNEAGEVSRVTSGGDCQ
jgi:hypothetical protein